MKNILTAMLLLMGLSIIHAQKNIKMNEGIHIQNASVVEYVTFIAKEGVTKQELLDAAHKTDAVLEEIDGYIHRFIAYRENNTWVEIVFWENKKLAEQGLTLFLNHPKSKLFLEKIQEGSVKIEYSNLL